MTIITIQLLVITMTSCALLFRAELTYFTV